MSLCALYCAHMDAIPFAVLLAPYLLVLAVAAIFLFFNVFHLWRYGVDGPGTSLLIAVYIGLFIVIVGGTWVSLSGFAWTGTFSLADFLPRSPGISSFGL